jgi:hypothetical protein
MPDTLLPAYDLLVFDHDVDVVLHEEPKPLVNTATDEQSERYTNITGGRTWPTEPSEPEGYVRLPASASTARSVNGRWPRCGECPNRATTDDRQSFPRSGIPCCESTRNFPHAVTAHTIHPPPQTTAEAFAIYCCLAHQVQRPNI